MFFALMVAVLVSQASPSAQTKELEALTQRVDAALKQHRSADAIGMLQSAVRAHPQWQRGWWLLGSVLYDTDNYSAARPVLERLVQMDPKSGGPWMLLGLCEFEMRDYGMALQHLQRGDAFGVPPELDLLEVVRYHEALLLMQAERFDPAQLLLDQLTRRGLDSDEIVLTQGLAALRIPIFPAALHHTASEDRIELIRRVGRAQHAIAQDKPRDAVEMYKDLVKGNPAIANLHLSYAAVLLQIRERQAAEVELRTELSVNAQSVEARLRLCVLLEEDAPSDAIAMATEAVALDPKSFKTHFFLGKLLFKAEKLEQSAKELEISRELDPSSSAVRFALIRVYKSLGREAEAAREAELFQRLRIAEDQFRKSGRVSASYFEPEASDSEQGGKAQPPSAPGRSKAAAPR